MSDLTSLKENLKKAPKAWLITGGAGFIGSHLTKNLLDAEQNVKVIDDLSSGFIENITDVMDHPKFSFIQGDIRSQEFCKNAVEDIDYVLHHAAIGSVVKSIEDPALVDAVNNGGFINILNAAKQKSVSKIVYASSSAVYGDKNSENPRQEDDALSPVSPYASTKCANEAYATAFSQTYDLGCTGLRYFNIYGPNQDSNGAYAAVIPKWIDAMLANEAVTIFGDGETVRDFCFIDDVVYANIFCALNNEDTDILNIASGSKATLNQLFDTLKDIIGYTKTPVYEDFRPSDIKISMADTCKMKEALKKDTTASLKDGLQTTVEWYERQKHAA